MGLASTEVKSILDGLPPLVWKKTRNLGHWQAEGEFNRTHYDRRTSFEIMEVSHPDYRYLVNVKWYADYSFAHSLADAKDIADSIWHQHVKEFITSPNRLSK